MMLAIALIVVSVILFVAHRLDAAGWETLSVVAEGLSIAAWLLLWHPLDALVFNRWDFRLDRRVLRTIRPLARGCTLQERGPARCLTHGSVALAARAVLPSG